MKHHNSQSGNVLFYILIAVALLAALSFAVTQSGRGSGKAISDERANLAASEMIEYSNTVASAVTQLRLRGCQDTQINFDNNVVSGYNNTLAPDDESCNVFSLNGGGVQWRNLEAEWLDSAVSSSEDEYGVTLYTAKTCIDELGKGFVNCQDDTTEAAEMIMAMSYLKKEICININNRLNIGFKNDNPPLVLSGAWASGGRKFIGTNFNGGVRLTDSGTTFAGKSSGCFKVDTYPVTGYHFYKVLMSR